MITTDNKVSEYELQALDFLANTNVTMTADRSVDNSCPMWCDGKHIHGNEYIITFERDRTSVRIFGIVNTIKN